MMLVHPAAVQAQDDPPDTASSEALIIEQKAVFEFSPALRGAQVEFETSSQHHTSDQLTQISEVLNLTIQQPFDGTPYAAHVVEQGLGRVRSMQLVYTAVSQSLPDEAGVREWPNTVAFQFLAAVGHRRFELPPGSGHADKVPFAFGTRIALPLPWDMPVLGRLNLGLGLQHRTQYVPDVVTGGPVRLRGATVEATVDGALPRFAIFSSGLSYSLSGAHDLDRDVTGAELTLSTPLSVIEFADVLVGLSVRVQQRDNDPRTRDDVFGLSPEISVQF